MNKDLLFNKISEYMHKNKINPLDLEAFNNIANKIIADEFNLKSAEEIEKKKFELTFKALTEQEKKTYKQTKEDIVEIAFEDTKVVEE